MRPNKILIALLMCLPVIMGSAITSVFAGETPSPPQVAELMRQQLFHAQVALMHGDSAGAETAIGEAQQLYVTALQTPIRAVLPEHDRRIAGGLSQAGEYARAGNTAGLAVMRGRIWTMLLAAGSQMVYRALATGDSAMALLWLPLREFRPATRFSRPAVDATLAVSGFAREVIPAEAALQSVQSDLLDTCQARLMGSLVALKEAHSRHFTLRRAEETGLAAGYFAMLADTFGAQRGPQALTEMQGYFDRLVAAAVAGDEAAFETLPGQIEAALAGFRAVPLSDQELARRAGQFVRYLTLVPVEYARGVRDGVVVNDIEVQEALTFYEGAAAAFADMETALNARDTRLAAQLKVLLARIREQIRQVAAPDELQAAITEIQQLSTQVIPAEWLTASAGSDIDVIFSILDQVATAVVKQDYRAAEAARLEAYAVLELGIEQRLRGFAPEIALQIESLFWQGTDEQAGLAIQLATEAPLAAIRATLARLHSALDDARLILNAGRSAPEAVIGNAAVIVFREGLEAVLILASLLASLRTAEQLRFRRPLITGAGLALVATVVTWGMAANLLSALLPLGEKLEAIVSLIAIGVLLLITSWFFHKAYWTGWMAKFHARKRSLVAGVVGAAISQTIGLILLGFTSIYRGGFETVLFLQSLVLEAGTPVVLQGVALGLLATAGVGIITFKLQVRLPYKKMLIVTGVMIGVVLLTMVGHTVHVLQSLGWLPITPIQGIYVPFWMGQWFGLFATWQGIGLQLGAAVFVIGSYFVAAYQNKRNRELAGRGGQQAAA